MIAPGSPVARTWHAVFAALVLVCRVLFRAMVYIAIVAAALFGAAFGRPDRD